MEQDKLRAILAKYWEGETTLEEERLLQRHAAQIEDAELRAYFQGMRSFSQMAMRPPAEVPMEQKPTVYKSLRVWLPYAAAACLALMVWWNLPSGNSSTYNALHQETFEDPEFARLQAEEALSYVIGRMRSGQKTSQKQFKKIETLSLVIPK